MPMDIAVYLGDNGKPTSLYEKGTLAVYQRRQGQWNIIRQKDFCPQENLGMKDLRQKMKDMIVFLESCKTLVGSSVTGIPYFELEKAHCSIWEYQGSPLEFLDYIMEKEEAEQLQREQQKVVTLPVPVETFHGCYRISLKEIQEQNTGFTSKQALLPFIRKGNFFSLEVLCNHIPPWLETEIQIGSLQGRSEVMGKNEIKLTITKKCCGT
ncbi:Fe-only nitrogenase accessory AnfO family protein [Desulforamulus ruminis]|uniref:Nitrogenase iron-iron accessory protein AnfO n=1 Tax=Desulforamulus ruminis (strain ATCC 23193 / DSM 2154 / NCIMB 8452 / DL) TaxID=696281 RepID=F6DLK6_DESRL|nr:Fe-only nitrogenase accessory AnfO family protein [Desulforamulus ruminis]AEG61648.1 Nitrogenase iron-iron accessory protein AnfO [Desulforamulus ruminis DSM 2154]